MILSSKYTINFLPSFPPEINLPFEVRRETHSLLIEEDEDIAHPTVGTVSIPIDPSKIEIIEDSTIENFTYTGPWLLSPEYDDLVHYLELELSLLSFLTDTPARFSHLVLTDELIPESDAEIRFLELLPNTIYIKRFDLSLETRTFKYFSPQSTASDKLLQRAFGLALYHQALLIQDPLGSFREYWKLLESAFSKTDEKLLDLLESYQPAKKLQFGRDELNQLLIIRGRASHAQSRLGITEHRQVRDQVAAKLPRLKNLAEQVLLTKKTWGTPTTAIDRTAPLLGFTTVDGGVYIE